MADDGDTSPMMALHVDFLRRWADLLPEEDRADFRAHALAMLGVARTLERQRCARLARAYREAFGDRPDVFDAMVAAFAEPVT